VLGFDRGALVRFLNSGDKPSNFREWLVWRIQRSPRGMFPSDRAEQPPKYLRLDRIIAFHPDPKRVTDVEHYAKAELRAMRDEGLIASVGGRWYLRIRPTKCKRRA
jgi:hypothetical protein